MTGAQKQHVQLLRSRGLPFSQIAQEVGVSVNTVKSFCRRSALPTVGPSKESEIKEAKKEEVSNEGKELRTHCKSCGKPLAHLPKAKPKQFCNDGCRAKWWNGHREEMNRRTVVPATCAGCGAMFMRYAKAGRKYCSHACYISARFVREVLS